MGFIVRYWPKGYADPEGLKRVRVEANDPVVIKQAMRAAGHPWGEACYVDDETPPKSALTPEQVEAYVQAFKGDNT